MRASRFGSLMVIREYLNGLVMSVPGGGTMDSRKERAMEFRLARCCRTSWMGSGA